MTTPIVPSKPNTITWDFQIAEQGFTSRYGHLGEDFYRQYLPFGILDQRGHPPKKITSQLYNLARLKQISRALPKTA